MAETEATQHKGGPVIEIDHVTKRFGDYVAVADADFTIAQGEFFSMLGPSGCGKTTTLRMIAGFETPTEGAIRLEGTDVSKTPPVLSRTTSRQKSYSCCGRAAANASGL